MRIKPNADGHFCSWNSAFLYRWPVGQAVKTAASHAANGSSILPRVTTSEWTTFHSKSPAIRLGFSHTISLFLLFPTKLCKANFCGGPAAGGKTNAPAEWIAFHSKTQANGWAFLIPFRHSSLTPQNFARQTFAGAPLPGENERPGRMDCIPFKNSGKWLGFSHTISSFLLFPAKLCKANFCGGPAAGGKRTPRQDELHFIQRAQLFCWAFSCLSGQAEQNE